MFSTAFSAFSTFSRGPTLMVTCATISTATAFSNVIQSSHTTVPIPSLSLRLQISKGQTTSYPQFLISGFKWNLMVFLTWPGPQTYQNKTLLVYVFVSLPTQVSHSWETLKIQTIFPWSKGLFAIVFLLSSRVTIDLLQCTPSGDTPLPCLHSLHRSHGPSLVAAQWFSSWFFWVPSLLVLFWMVLVYKWVWEPWSWPLRLPI